MGENNGGKPKISSSFPHSIWIISPNSAITLSSPCIWKRFRGGGCHSDSEVPSLGEVLGDFWVRSANKWRSYVFLGMIFVCKGYWHASLEVHVSWFFWLVLSWYNKNLSTKKEGSKSYNLHMSDVLALGVYEICFRGDLKPIFFL